MAEIVGSAESFAQGFVDAVAEVAVVLDERAHRLLLGAAARQIGRDEITLVAGVSGASPDTVSRGAAELEAGVVAEGRVRASGAGRKVGGAHRPAVVAGAGEAGGPADPWRSDVRGSVDDEVVGEAG